jgi:hypothetical protein
MPTAIPKGLKSALLSFPAVPFEYSPTVTPNKRDNAKTDERRQFNHVEKQLVIFLR